MKYYIIAGEASGDLHASKLIRAIKKLDNVASIRAWGGDLMEKEGAVVVKHYRDLAFMGFAEVVANLRTILNNMRFCKEDILSFQPDVVVFVDYPGFNIPIAQFAKKRGFKTAYYISPQVWAWKESRVKKIKQSIDRMMVILPFEKSFYQKWNFAVDYVGHPLIEAIEEFKQNLSTVHLRSELSLPDDKKIIALLPGSRKQEIKVKLPIMLEAAQNLENCMCIVAQAPGIEDEFINQIIKDSTHVKVIKGNTYGLLNVADAAMVTSGTATLETALFHVPEVVCYKGSSISYAIAKRLIRVKFISLVNLIMEKEIVKELIQHEMNAKEIRKAITPLIQDPEKIERIKSQYKELETILKQDGKASEKAASIIVELGSSISSRKASQQ